MGERTCDWCGKTFEPFRRNTRTCSRECRVLDNRKRQNAKRAAEHPAILCAVCGKEFRRVRIDSRTCSNACYQRAGYEKAAHQRKCRACALEFTATRPEAKYCSALCSQRQWRRENPGVHRLRARAYESRRKTWLARELGELAEEDWQRMVRRHPYCYYCGAADEPLQMDHVTPLSKGGRHTIGNVVPACGECNLSKSARALSTWRYRHARTEVRVWLWAQTRTPAASNYTAGGFMGRGAHGGTPGPSCTRS